VRLRRFNWSKWVIDPVQVWVGHCLPRIGKIGRITIDPAGAAEPKLQYVSETWLNSVRNNAGGQHLVVDASSGLKSHTTPEVDPHF